MFNPLKKVLAGIAALAALALGGAAIAGAASSTSTSSTSTSSGGGQTQQPSRPAPSNMPAHGSAAHEDAETPVTGEAASKAQAAAVKAVGGGTAGAVTTDFTKNGYETTVTKSDGTKVEVHLDGSFNAMQGPGGPGGAPAGRPPSGSPPAGAGSPPEAG